MINGRLFCFMRNAVPVSFFFSTSIHPLTPPSPLFVRPTVPVWSSCGQLKRLHRIHVRAAWVLLVAPSPPPAPGPGRRRQHLPPALGTADSRRFSNRSHLLCVRACVRAWMRACRAGRVEPGLRAPRPPRCPVPFRILPWAIRAAPCRGGAGARLKDHAGGRRARRACPPNMMELTGHTRAARTRWETSTARPKAEKMSVWSPWPRSVFASGRNGVIVSCIVSHYIYPSANAGRGVMRPFRFNFTLHSSACYDVTKRNRRVEYCTANNAPRLCPARLPPWTNPSPFPPHWYSTRTLAVTDPSGIKMFSIRLRGLQSNGITVLRQHCVDRCIIVPYLYVCWVYLIYNPRIGRKLVFFDIKSVLKRDRTLNSLEMLSLYKFSND